MITDPIGLEVLDRSSEPATVVRGFSHVSRSHYLGPLMRENSPLRYGSTARSVGGSKLMRSSVFGLRLVLTLPCNTTTGVVQ